MPNARPALELWNALAFLHKTKISALRSYICFSTLPRLSHLTAVVAYVTSPPIVQQTVSDSVLLP